MNDRREHTFTTLSGVSVTVSELTGMHQRYITEKRFQKNGKGFDLLLQDCIIRLGNKTNLTEKDVNNILSGDRKHILVELRQFSLDYQKNFDFDYEWAMKSGHTQKQAYTVNFSPEDFPFHPYAWVREAYNQAVADAQAKAEQEGREFTDDERWRVPIPDLYPDYQTILEKKEYEVVLPRSGVKVKMNLMDGVGETHLIKMPEEDQSSHTPIKLRNPQTIEMKEGKEREYSLNLDKLSLKDISFLRKSFKDMEGDIDTSMVIANQNDPNQTLRVNLIGLPDFFFPSVVN